MVDRITGSVQRPGSATDRSGPGGTPAARRVTVPSAPPSSGGQPVNRPRGVGPRTGDEGDWVSVGERRYYLFAPRGSYLNILI